MSFYFWKPYVSAAERRKKAQKAAARVKKTGGDLSPITGCRGAIARTFWGKAWCESLERYSDYANRLPRGRTYVRNGSVIDLKITEGEVQARVVGSSLYKVSVTVVAVPKKQWRSISADCAGSIDSLVELLQGKLSKAVMQRICMPNTGLFPAPKEIEFSCSCPDWAVMCKHVAAVLYGVGARLDERPELIFTLRGVDAKELITQAGAGFPKSKPGPTARKVLDDGLLAEVFGIEMAISFPAAKAAATPQSSTAPKGAKRLDTAADTRIRRVLKGGKTDAIKKTGAAVNLVKAKVPAQSSTSPRKSTTRKAKAGGTTTVQERKAASRRQVSGQLAKKKSR